LRQTSRSKLSTISGVKLRRNWRAAGSTPSRHQDAPPIGDTVAFSGGWAIEARQRKAAIPERDSGRAYSRSGSCPPAATTVRTLDGRPRLAFASFHEAKEAAASVLEFPTTLAPHERSFDATI
jgi:hypothetical protein